MENNIKITNNEYVFNLKDLDSGNKSQWCPGCGNFGIVMAIKKAILNLKLDPKDVLIVSGIGCSSKTPHYIKTFGIETIHGRAIPVASGAKMANKDLHVIVVGGDGDGYGIGLGHFVHSMRRNCNITYIVHDNQIYGLTKGQTSPTTQKAVKSVSTPNGAIETPINPIVLSLASGATYIAKGFSGEIDHLSKLIENGIKHKGFSIIDVGQVCVSYNPVMSNAWYRERIIKIEELEGYNPDDKHWAYEAALSDQKEKIPIGVYYQEKNNNCTYLDELPESHELPLVKQDISNIDIEKELDKYE